MYSSTVQTPSRRRAVDLMVGTALGCSLLVLAAPARADNECGAPVGGVVTCAAAGSPYAGGIAYTAGASGLTMNIQAGTNIDAAGRGVLIAGTGPVIVNAQDTNVRGTGTTYGAIEVRTTDNISVFAGAVENSGGQSKGVAAVLTGDGSGTRHVLVSADDITVSGVQARGVYAVNNSGNIGIDVGTIAMTGDGAMAVIATGSADVSVAAGEISTAGDRAYGVAITASGSVAVDVGSVRTSGELSTGIWIESQGGEDVEVNFNSITTDGHNAAGISIFPTGGEVIVRGGSVTALGGGDDYGAAIQIDHSNPVGQGPHTVTVEVDSIVTGREVAGVHSGDNGHGLWVQAAGDVNFDIGSIVTHGLNAQGVTIGAQGQITGVVGTIETWGEGAHGLNLDSAAGVEAEFGSIITHGDLAKGAQLYSENGDITLTGGDIETFGYAGHALFASSAYGDITLDIGTVRTHGEAAAGVFAQGGYEEEALISIAADSIETSGEAARGLTIQPQDASATVALGSVKTTGDFSEAIFIDGGSGGSLTLMADEVTTTGVGSSAIVLSEGGDVNLDLGLVTTRGNNARGIEISRDPELSGPTTVVVTADAVHTGHRAEDGTITGYDAGAILISNGGDTTVDVGTVTTQGSSADAININALGTGHVTVTATGPIRTSGGNSSGVWIDGADGAVVHVADVSTKGSNSDAIRISAYEDDGPATGGVELVAGNVTTEGANARGVDVYAAGDVDIVLGDVSTEGDTSSAVRATSVNGSLEMRVGDVRTDGIASSALVAQALGDVTLVAGDITALSNVSKGLVAHSGAGDVTITAGDVTTNGRSDSDVITVSLGEPGVLRLTAGAVEARSGPDNEFNPGNSAVNVTNGGFSGIRIASALTNSVNAAAIQIEGGGTGDVDLNVTGAVRTTGNRAEGIRILNAHDIDIRAGSVTTAGQDSDGVKIGALDNTVFGDITLAINEVRTTGLRSNGLDIATDGDVAVTSQLVSTTGLESGAVRVDAGGAVLLHLGSAIASGTDGVAVDASGQTIEMTIATELHGTRVGADLRADGALTVALGANSSTTGSVFGLDLESGTGTTVTNRGSLGSTEGVALNVDGGAATVLNIGNLVGRIDLTGAADRLENSGTFRMRGESDFGAAADVLVNTGTLTFAESTTPLQARLRDLERFDNAGVIDLTNGVAGDLLTIDGVLNGQAGNSVRLDLDTRTATVAADRLAVGSLEGVTQVRLEVLGTGVLGDTGVTLITSGAAQTGQEVAVTVDSGFLEYEAMFDAASREYRVVGLVDEERAFEPTKVASGGQLQWRRGADVISARLDELSDGAALGLPRGEHAQTWIQAYGGSSDVDARRTIDGEAVDLSHDVDVAGAQMGVDILRGLGGGDLVLGAAASYGETQLAFASNGDRADFTGWGLAAYAQWTKGPLVLGVTAKADQYELDYDWTSVDLTDTADGRTVGARIDAAWRLETGTDWRIEPRVSLSWTDTDLDGIEAEAGEVEFGDTVSLLGKFGLRVARGVTLSTGAQFQPYAGVYAFNEFEGDNVSRIHLSSETIDVSDIAAERWGEAVLGANLAYGPVQAFVQGEASFGEIEGFTARIGARLNW